MTTYVGTVEAARIAGVHKETMRQWASEGRVPALRTPTGRWRFNPDDLLQATKVTPQPPRPRAVVKKGGAVEAAMERQRKRGVR